MVIMGIDPGNARCGWGVIEKKGSRVTYVAAGCIETHKSTPREERLLELNRELSKLVVNFSPDESALEDLFFFKNPKTIIGVAEARGVILCSLAAKGIPLFSYTPLQVKQAVASYGRAEKNQVLKMVMRILGLKQPPKPDDAADALAIALCHSAIPDSLKFRKKNSHA